MTSVDIDRCIFGAGVGRCILSPEFDRLNGAPASPDEGGRRFGRSSSDNEGNRELELKPSDDLDFLKSTFLVGSGNASPDFDRPSFGGPDFWFITIMDCPRCSPLTGLGGFFPNDNDDGWRLDTLRDIDGFFSRAVSDDESAADFFFSNEASSSSSSKSGYVLV